MYRKLLSILFVLPLSVAAFGQYNFNAGYEVVYSILNTKCSNAGCHSATSAQSLRFDTSSAAVYASINNQPPVNTGAVSRGEKLVWGQQPYQSYLLKKAASWLDTDLSLPANETDSAHTTAGLTTTEAEYIRQWIINNSPQTGNSIDTAIVNQYYSDTTNGPFFPKLPKPAPGTGVQLRFGPIFMRNASGNNEVEYLLMNQLNFPTPMEVTGMNVSMSSFSHHFILFKFDDSASAMAKLVGLRKVVLSAGSTVSPFDGNKSVASVWVYAQDVQLPTGTAFFWPATTYIDFDFHVKNYSTYRIMPFDVYVNLAANTRNVADTVIEMKSRLNNNNTLGTLDIHPPYHYNSIAPHATSICIDEDQDNGSGGMRYLWLLNSHTHKMGVGFNIYTFNTSKPNDLGDTIYNGNYDYNAPGGVVDYGYYDWEHPSVEFFNPLKPIDFGSSGLIAETAYRNDSSFYQTFGFTTANEMQLFYYLYTSQLPGALGVKGIDQSAFALTVYPNPMSGQGTLNYTLPAAATVRASILDVTGKEIAALRDEKEQAGKYSIDLGDRRSLSAGIYLARLTVDGETITRKFIVE